MIEFTQKGVTMLVSAISANRNQTIGTTNSIYSFVNTKGGDFGNDKAFSALTSYAKRSSLDNRMTQLYDSINEWKSFCHKQIEKGNLDVLA